MIRRAAAETISDYEALATKSSNLMLAATSHRAKDEVFEAAVAWVEAGRTLVELGSKLLYNDYVREGAQEILHAAGCFLEGGDHRPADEQLARFDHVPQLEHLLKEDEYLSAEFVRISKWSRGLRGKFDKTLREMREQMQGPSGAQRLKQGWIDEAFHEFPGVPDFHFFAARKYAHVAGSRGAAAPRERAIQHYRWCAQLLPERIGLWILVAGELLEAHKWDEAIATAERTVERFPDSALAQIYSGWCKLLRVTKHQGPKSLLHGVLDNMEHAIRLRAQLAPDHLVVAYGCRAVCLHCLGERDKGETVLREAIHELPPGTSSPVLLATLNAQPSEREKVFLARAPEIMSRLPSEAASTESMYAGAA